MDENDMNIQKYLIWFDEVEKISLLGDDEDWILSDSDTESTMDQNEMNTQPNTNSGYEYTPNATAFNPTEQICTGVTNEYKTDSVAYNPTTVNYQYAGDVIPAYTNSETVVNSYATTGCNVGPTNYEYESNYLAPNNFYGNSTCGPNHYQKVGDGNFGFSHYGQGVTTECNTHSDDVHNVSDYATQETVIEAKPAIIDEVCVEEAKIEVKTEELQSQPMDESHSLAHQNIVVEHTTVTINHEEEPQQVYEEKPQQVCKEEPQQRYKEEPQQVYQEEPQQVYQEEPQKMECIEVQSEDDNTCDAKASENVHSTEVSKTAEETTNQSIANGNKPVETVIQNVQMCIRSGCVNQAIINPEWEQEFCSNECVILHCKNVFTAWVKSNEVVI